MTDEIPTPFQISETKTTPVTKVHTRDDIIAFARSWLGVPFRHQGRDRYGIDCVGLTVKIAEEIGVFDVDVSGYSRRSYGPKLLEPFYKHCRPIPFQQARPGDIIVFYDNVYPAHVGVMAHRLGQPDLLTVIHAVASLRSVAETPWLGTWRAKARKAFIFPGIA